MSWQRHMKLGRSKLSNVPQSNSMKQPGGSKTNFASYLPAVYTGLSNRVDRYKQYDQMDQDPEIRTALNIISDFCTQSSEDFGLPFQIKYKDTMGDTEVTTLEDRLESWDDLNQFKIRMYDIIRGILKYGDQFFIRDPETFEWYWVDPKNVDKIIVNNATGKNPIIYYMREVRLNIRDKVMSNPTVGFDKQAYPGAIPNSLQTGASQYGSVGTAMQSDGSSQFSTNGQMDVIPVAAEHVIHLSLNTGQDSFWPFGTSILENIFKVYKQKELLEDSIIIYRVQRAPERRVFKIDVGDMQAPQAFAYVERVKNDIHQRRIPSNKGGSTSLMDAAYNPLCLDMNTRIPLLDGRTLSIWELQEEYKAGKENWAYSCHPETGEIVPGVITWAGVTKEKSKVLKIYLDNGEHLICTEDHKIPVLNYGFKEAKDLTPDDVLIEFSTKNSEIKEQQKWKKTKDVVGNYFKEINKHQVFHYKEEYIKESKDVIIHKDKNESNNDPRNIQFMNKDDFEQFSTNEGYSSVLKDSQNISGSTSVLRIEYLDDEITVGTITIDGTERWHNYHTFAIESGIFVKNSILEDYFFPQTAEGRGSSVETLPGGDNLGQIDDLRYFNNKLIRGLQIPASYLPMGPDDGGVALFGDGATQAMASELRFNNECMRYQRIVSRTFDEEFKRYLIKNGYNISTSSFEVTFNPPMNFAANRKAEMDAKLIQTYLPLNDLKYFSKQFIMQKMGFDQKDIVENERLWMQENPELSKNVRPDSTGSSGLQSVGIESPNNPEQDLGMDNDGNMESADADFQESDFNPDNLGNTF